MNSHSDAKSVLAQVLWPDAELCRLEVDYSDLRLVVKESTGLVKQVTCEGYLGYELTGFWDEMIISSAALANEGAFLERCLENITHRFGGSPPPSGNEVRNRERAMQFILNFSDGCQLNVAIKGLRVDFAQ